jgi:hypothetical protein
MGITQSDANDVAAPNNKAASRLQCTSFRREPDAFGMFLMDMMHMIHMDGSEWMGVAAAS